MTINNDWIHDVMSLPYHSGTRLEDAVQEVLEAHSVINAGEEIKDPIKHYCFSGSDHCRQGAGISPETIRDNKRFLHIDWFDVMDMSQILDDWNYYIAQPNGSSSPPDQLYIQYGEICKLECKSSQDNKFRFNNTYPSCETVYIFSSKRHNMTRVSMGYHISCDFDPEVYEVLAKRRVKECDKIMKQDSIDLGLKMKAYVRLQYDLIEHEDLVLKAEQNDWCTEVINYLDMRLNNSNKNNVNTQPEIINTTVYDNVLNYHR